MARIFFLISSEFPYGKGETFIENEIEQLASLCDKLVIISNHKPEGAKRPLPANCCTEYLSYQLPGKQYWLTLSQLFSSFLYAEMAQVLFRYKMKPTVIILRTMIASLCKIRFIGKQIETMVQQHSNTDDNACLYSYWANDMALAASYVRCPQISRKISRAHGWDVYFEANKAKYLPFRKLLLQKMDKLCFISDAGFNYYSALFPALKNKMLVSRLGVKPGGILTVPDNNVFRIVSCSNLIPLKRVQLIAEALRMIDFAIEWVHFGDGPLMPQLQLLCGAIRSPNVKIELKGRLPNADVVDYYKRKYVDLFINVSTSEGIPVSIMEAMSCGIPCAATDVGGSSEVVTKGTGYLLPAHISAADLAGIITRHKMQPAADANTMRIAALENWRLNYNAELNYADFAENILGK
jgi:glycosyltransferase involved in cell wall biosynthesis